jgi:pSer/pThr/pTyr-binding forkhead associated (FHA) protein
MSPGLVLLILRLLMGVMLFGFLVVILVFQRQDLQQHTPHTVVMPAACLMPTTGSEEGTSFQLENINLIGRAADNTIVLEDEIVSAHHARLSYLSGRQWWLEDLGSRNGTTVNAMHVDEPLAVTEGDTISFGSVEFRLVVEDGSSAAVSDHETK